MFLCTFTDCISFCLFAAATHMPDAMETIYEKALAYGKSGGVSKTFLSRLLSKASTFCPKSLKLSLWVGSNYFFYLFLQAEEYLNNKESAGKLYKKAILLLTFIIEEAVTLPLNPPFSLTSDDKKRILYYISNLQHRRSHL